ncbi:MAG: mitochondrial fission ELM1 family protein [Desulfobulbales bacterium]|nr:mitochondrial fission ELM1 family protein [Desulfobulbales bacterium]
MKPLSIAAYFDGRLGHEKQTLGILQALAAITPTEVIEKNVPVSPVSFCRNWMSYILASLHEPVTGQYPGVVDLIIGSGTHTHIPMLLEKKSRSGSTGHKVYVVTCMSPDPQLFKKFDLCCIPEHDEPPPRKNVFITLGPPNTVVLRDEHQSDKGLILIGGLDKKSHIWKSSEVINQVTTIVTNNKNLHWAISSSPRTPEETCVKLEELAASMQQATFYRSADTSAGWIEKEYARNRTVWVTADSISMVYEALSAGCSVGILPVTWLRQNNKFQKSLDILKEKNMVIYFDDWQSTAAMPAPQGKPFNEAERCAREILRRWWPDRLQ